MTDTQYFPTDEIDQNPAEVSAADTTASQKDVAFLGYAICLLRRGSIRSEAWFTVTLSSGLPSHPMPSKLSGLPRAILKATGWLLYSHYSNGVCVCFFTVMEVYELVNCYWQDA